MIAGAGATEPVIAVDGLTKRYGSTVAVDRVDLHVWPGEIFGILGPNGAGKTTTLEIIEGLREPDSGAITVDGVDVVRRPNDVKRRIGIQLQTTALFEHLSVEELVALFASLYGADSSPLAVSRLLGMVNLEAKAAAKADQLSGGQQQRLSIALALVNDPVVVFLDEPTTGLDPQARRNLWEVVNGIRDAGSTVVLTTHYMEEAEVLCDRVAVMDAGRIILCDTPVALIDTLDVRASVTARFVDAGPARAELDALPETVGVEYDGKLANLQTRDLKVTLRALMSCSDRLGIEIEHLSTTRPTLEDVFLHYTGKALRE